MAKDFAEKFYNSKKWINCREGFMQSKNYICERCKEPSLICHHKIYLDESNIKDVEISLNWENLESLCLECHNRTHGNNKTIREGLAFNSNGDIIPT